MTERLAVRREYMRDEIDFGRLRLVNLLQNPPSPLRHDYQPGRESDQFLRHATLPAGPPKDFRSSSSIS